MITEILMAGFLRPNLRLNSKNCITYLYVDVKEPAKPCGLRSVWIPEFLPSLKLKTVVLALIPSDGGRGRIRTCDPALIKRML